MAHRSRKKHIKHLHQQEAATPKAKSPAAKAKAAPAKARTATKARPAKAARTRTSGDGAAPTKKSGGIVRSLARAATKKIAARPRRIISKAKSRVKSLIGT
jgi:hypothetical protein